MPSPAIVSLGALVLLLLPVLLGQARPSIGAETRQEDGRWVVARVESGSIAERAGLQVDDGFAAVDGRPPGVLLDTAPGLDLSQTREWTVDRAGQPLTLRPDAGAVAWHVRGEPVLMLAVALAFWGLATFVRIGKPDDERAHRFHWLNLAIATVLAMSPAVENDVLWAKALNVLALSLLPALFLGFFHSFAWGRPLTRRVARVVRGLSAFGLGAGLLYLVAGVAHSSLYDPARMVLLLLLVFGVVGGLGSLIRAYAHPRSPGVRRQLHVVLLGAAGAVFPLTLLALIPEVVGLAPLVRPQLAALSVVALPSAFAYAILRQQVPDVEVIVERALVSGVMLLLLAGFYGLIVYAVHLPPLRPVVEESQLAVILVMALATAAFGSVWNQVRRVVDKAIFRDHYDYVKTLQELGAQLTTVQPIEHVLATIVDGLAGAMNLRGAAVLLCRPEGDLAVRAASGDYRDPARAQALVEMARRSPGETAARGAGLWIPLVVHEEECGVLYLGAKRLQAQFSAQDRSLAEAIAGQAAIAIANALLIERLQCKVAELELLRARLVSAQEEERKRLARNLHDGTLHTVLELIRQAETMLRTAPSETIMAERFGERLHYLAERGRDAAYELRMVCAELYPSELRHLGLVAALECLARRMSQDENVVVHFSSPTFSDEYRLPDAVEETLYRVAREALVNVCRHAGATTASVELGLTEKRVALAIRDDGRGFLVPPSRGALLRKGHLGLASMSEQIEHLGGMFAVFSAPGAGTEVRVHLPVGDRQESRPPPFVGASG